MLKLSGSELLFYSGLVMMGMAVLLAVLYWFLLIRNGRKLKKKLEEEYGKPRQ